MSSNSSRKKRRRKSGVDLPPKPYPDFPLGAAPCGYWQKRIRGKLHYFGKWGHVRNGKLERIQEDGCWQQALELYEKQRDALFAGRVPRIEPDGLTVATMCNHFLTAKLRRVESGELSPRSFAGYKHTTDRLVTTFGKDRLVDDLTAEDFASLRASLAKQYGPVRLGNEVQEVRTVFKFGFEAGLIDKPMRFGPEFKKPSASVLRRHRASNAPRLFEAAEVRAILDKASPQLRAMIYLGINCGMGNHDCSSLPLTAVDLARGWINFPRPKTGIDRRCPLWTETVEALKAAIADRPAPKHKDDADAVFVTKYGHRYVRTSGSNHAPVDGIGQEFSKVLRALHINGRKGLGFYSLRHTFRTIADATKDFPAIRLVMGHTEATIDAAYREKIDDARLVAVAEYVHRWLFGI